MYSISIDAGRLSDDHKVYRCFVVKDGKQVVAVKNAQISCGYGIMPGDAVKDFVRRNNDDILSQIYEKEYNG